jgi:hypothetical protein
VLALQPAQLHAASVIHLSAAQDPASSTPSPEKMSLTLVLARLGRTDGNERIACGSTQQQAIIGYRLC